MTSTAKKPTVDESRIGEMAAIQPLSGIKSVSETFAVSGLGRGGYARHEEAEKESGE
jgi:hypothetical protein